MSRSRIFAIVVVVSLLVCCIVVDWRTWVTHQRDDMINTVALPTDIKHRDDGADQVPRSDEQVVKTEAASQRPEPTWRLNPDSTHVHAVLPIAARHRHRNPDGRPRCLALIKQQYTFHRNGITDDKSWVFWVVEYVEDEPMAAGRIVGLIHPMNSIDFLIHDVRFVSYAQGQQFLIVISQSHGTSRFIQIFGVGTERAVDVIEMNLPESSSDWPQQLQCMPISFENLGITEKYDSLSPVKTYPDIVVATKEYVFGEMGMMGADFQGWSIRRHRCGIVDFKHVDPDRVSPKRDGKELNRAVAWQPDANCQKVITTSHDANVKTLDKEPLILPRRLAVVEQEFERPSDSNDGTFVRAKAYWVLDCPPGGQLDGAIPQYFIPPDETRRMEVAQILKPGLPHQEPNYLAAAEIDGSDLVIRFYSLSERLEGRRPLELDTVPKDWPTRVEPTAELRIKSPVKKLESFVAHASNENLIFEVADDSSQEYFNYSQKAGRWTRLEVSKQGQITK